MRLIFAIFALMSIVILSVFVILMILGIVFAFVPLDEGQLGIKDYKNFALYT